MSRLSFVVFCIEHYAEHVGKPGDEVYALFRRSGLLDLLREDYEDLHGMGLEYMVHFCDEYLTVDGLPTGTDRQSPCCRQGRATHATVKTLLIPEIVGMIAERFNWSEEEALDRFYTSATGASLADDETGLYGQSALFTYGLFAEEYNVAPFPEE